MPTSTSVATARPAPEAWRPRWWNRSWGGSVIYEYDWFDWLIRLAFFVLGLLIGFVAWHGLHLSVSF